jgi:hypothetical protein
MSKKGKEEYVFTGPEKGKGCGNCKHLYPGRLFTTCAAFPHGIPLLFLNNDEFHGKPFPGGHGIQYEPKPPIDAEALIEDLKRRQPELFNDEGEYIG